MNSPANDMTSRFEIYKTENGVMIERLLLYHNRNHPDWRLIDVLLPEGKYSLTIVGVMGIPFKSDVGFASVRINYTDLKPEKPAGILG